MSCACVCACVRACMCVCVGRGGDLSVSVLVSLSISACMCAYLSVCMPMYVCSIAVLLSIEEEPVSHVFCRSSYSDSTPRSKTA